MITPASIKDVINLAVMNATEGRAAWSREWVIDQVAVAVMSTIKDSLEKDGLIITEGGGPHLLDANDKTVWRAEAVAGVAAHVDPDSPRASAMIIRRFGR